MDRSYRGGVLRSRVLTRMEWLERETKTYETGSGWGWRLRKGGG
jgi:hypothetical protein